MAHRNPTSARKCSAPDETIRRSSELPRLQSSVSAQTNPRHLTLPVNGYCQSPAERYIAARAQLVPDYDDLSPETSSSVSSSSTGTSRANSLGSSSAHDQLMNQWHQQKSEEIRKKEKHRYAYGPPSSVERPAQQGTLQKRLLASMPSSPMVQPRTEDPPSSASPIRPDPVKTQKTVQSGERNLSKMSTDV